LVESVSYGVVGFFASEGSCLVPEVSIPVDKSIRILEEVLPKAEEGAVIKPVVGGAVLGSTGERKSGRPRKRLDETVYAFGEIMQEGRGEEAFTSLVLKWLGNLHRQQDYMAYIALCC
jgi:hypothetical protein